MSDPYLESVNGVDPLIRELVIHFTGDEGVGVCGHLDGGHDEDGASGGDKVAVAFPGRYHAIHS